MAKKPTSKPSDKDFAALDERILAAKVPFNSMGTTTGRTSSASPQWQEPPPANKPLLQRANELIAGSRQNDYGNKLTNFAQIAMLWNGQLALKLVKPITPEDVATMMIHVKLARLAKSPDHEDSILDIAGYAGCYEAVQLERDAMERIGGQLPGILDDGRKSPF